MCMPPPNSLPHRWPTGHIVRGRQATTRRHNLPDPAAGKKAATPLPQLNELVFGYSL